MIWGFPSASARILGESENNVLFSVRWGVSFSTFAQAGSDLFFACADGYAWGTSFCVDVLQITLCIKSPICFLLWAGERTCSRCREWYLFLSLSFVCYFKWAGGRIWSRAPDAKPGIKSACPKSSKSLVMSWTLHKCYQCS